MLDDPAREQVLLSGLHDIRLPVEAPGGVIAEIAAVVALAAFGALLTVALVRMIARRAGRGRQAPGAHPLDMLADLDADDRRVALLHLLRARDPERYASLRQTLYRRETTLDLAALEAEVRGSA